MSETPLTKLLRDSIVIESTKRKLVCKSCGDECGDYSCNHCARADERERTADLRREMGGEE